jgi:hypothetical protein
MDLAGGALAEIGGNAATSTAARRSAASRSWPKITGTLSRS